MKLCKFGLPAILAIAFVCTAQYSLATVLSSWTFEVNTPADSTNSAAGPVVNAETGLYSASSTLQGVHASANSDWTTPAGNGSANSYSANEWAVGDYTEIKTSSLGYYAITLKFDATSSNTGPRDFKVQTSLDGSTFADSGFTYSVLANASPNPTWNGTTSSPIYSYSFVFPTIANVHLKPNLYLRLVDTSTTSANGTTVATTGTHRIDNVSIEGTIVPEPATVGLALASLCCLLIRRK